MRDKRRASATRNGDGFDVQVPRPGGTGLYTLRVHDSGKVDGLPGTDDDVVVLYVTEAEIRAEGWPSIATKMMRENSATLRRYGYPHH